jgi:aerobic-type carbon monoxide dehydrogenase small subunit (CoxS/CutS family)
MSTIKFTVNGKAASVEADPAMPLLYALRDDLKLDNPHFGCGLAQCGACTVHLDGEPVRACVMPVSAAQGKAVVTISGLGTPDKPHPVQKAWIEEQVPQCGYCLNGWVMTSAAFLKKNPKASDADPMLINTICALSDPPQCLWAQREEETPRITNLRNLVGALPVRANTATEFLINFEDEGQGASKYADDRDWTMELEWRDDPDEAARAGGPTVVTLGNSFTTQSGELTFGYGNALDPDWFMNRAGLRGLNDYDAIFSELKSKGFSGWISIEDGVDGIDQLHRSVAFLKGKIATHWAGR